ncbi:MAG: TIM barrel protein [Chloroflexi bacterium]|nr:TIM barrel protein [Chloroflexota bacterium]
MDKLLFGTGGVPHSARTGSTIDGIRRIAELGLGCMELEFVQRVSMNEAGAKIVAEVAKQAGVKLSAHAPYYINLNSPEPDKIKASQERIFQTARIGAICGAESIVFHPAFYLGNPPSEAYDRVKSNLAEVLARVKELKLKVVIRPEIMGKTSQFGTLDEALRLSTELEGVAPCVDFAHWRARSEVNSYKEFVSVFEQIEKKLGRAAVDNIHIHVSGIEFGKSGERKHLDFKESDFQYSSFVKALKDCDIKGCIVCESPNLEKDALLLQGKYRTLPQTK